MSPDEEHPEYDWFHLHHLQSVRGDGAYYLNQKFIGKGGSYSAVDRNYPFAVMDFVPENLESKLGRGLPQIPRIEAIRYVFNIASGVSYLHSQLHSSGCWPTIPQTVRSQ